jgi:branched-chain amino acid transport system permease protein
MDILATIISGLVSGSAYALIALGIVIIFRSTHTVNFAIGDIGTLSVYVAVSAISIGLPIYAALLVAIVVAAAVGVLVERLLIRPLMGRRATLFVALVVTIGVSLVIQALIHVIWGFDSMRIQPIVGGIVRVFGIVLTWNKILAAAVALAALAIVGWFFAFTSTGSAMRASADDRFAAAVVGVRPNRLSVIAWALGCSLAAVAAFFLAADSSVNPHLATAPLFRAFAGVFLGGLSSMPGAAAGAFVIGVLDNLAGGYISSDFRDTIVFSLIVAVLFLKPSGFLGVGIKERV